MENIRPVVRRTYGRVSRPSVSSLEQETSHLFFGSSTPSLDNSSGGLSDSLAKGVYQRSSSPPSSSYIRTPKTSPRRNSSGMSFSPTPPRENLANEDDDLTQIPILVSKHPKTSTVPSKPIQGTLKSFFVPIPTEKRPLQPSSSIQVNPPSPLPESTELGIPTASSSKLKTNSGSKRLTQLHLTHLPLLHTCPQCLMSYVRGGDDEGVHDRHHSRVVRGIPWDGLGKGKGRAGKGSNGDQGVVKKGGGETGWRVVADDIAFGSNGRGRVVVADGSWGGMRLTDILSTVDTVLSSPPLPPAILDQCKIFLFLTASPPPTGSKRPRLRLSDTKASAKVQKERVVAVVVSQGIKWAMRVLKDGEASGEGTRVVDSGGGVVCDPKSLPTPLGIHRLFTIPSYRSLGLAQILLDYACSHTIYGCTFSPLKGHVAFSQPTQSGRAVMERWGQGQVRVFVDDESQL